MGLRFCVRVGNGSMVLTDQDVAEAEARMQSLRKAGYAVSARYDRQLSRILVTLHTGVEVSFPSGLIEGLAEASPDDLGEIEITPSGLGLHWPRLDADLYIPAALQGVFGSARWMASLAPA